MESPVAESKEYGTKSTVLLNSKKLSLMISMKNSSVGILGTFSIFRFREKSNLAS